MIVQLLGNQHIPVGGVLLTAGTAAGQVVLTITPSTTENERVVIYAVQFGYETTPTGRLTISDGVKAPWAVPVTAAGVHALGIVLPFTPKTAVTLTLLTSSTIVARLNAQYALVRC